MYSSIVEELLLIDKPKNITSFDVIRRLRRKYGVRKMGHSGTLDPLATGLMIIGIGEGTKKLKELIGLPKVYEASVLLGLKTTTGDISGGLIDRKKIQNISLTEIEKALREVTGRLVLPVPLYSAVKIGGRRLYQLAHQNKMVGALPKKEMEVFWIKLKNHYPEGEYYILELELEVRSGTYVRSIAEEIGRQLDVPATVKELRRTKIGPWSVKDADPLK